MASDSPVSTLVNVLAFREAMVRSSGASGGYLFSMAGTEDPLVILSVTAILGTLVPREKDELVTILCPSVT